MNVEPIHHRPLVPANAAPVFDAAASSFAARLQAAGHGQAVEQVREAAEQMVATTFVGPVLALMRESPLGGGPFAPGAAERRFTPLLDQQLADRVTRGANFPLVDSIAEHVLAAVERRAPALPPPSRED